MTAALENSILALDAYNRGYNAGLGDDVDGLGGVGENISHFTIISDSEAYAETSGEAAGFYAIAYRNNLTNEIIISYRGTDLIWANESFGSDFWNGWGVALSSPLGKQAELAIKFYQAVQNLNPGVSISFTGHSLGGGLAGLVAGIYQKEAMLFDNMPFEGAVQSAYNMATKTDVQLFIEAEGNLALYNNLVASRDALKILVYGSSTPTLGHSFPTSSITAFHTEGELLKIGRCATFQQTISGEMEHGYDVDLPGLVDGFEWHSRATLAMLAYAHGSGISNDWMHSAKYFWPELYNNDDNSIALHINLNSNRDVAGILQKDLKYSEILRGIIAYSAVDGGDGNINVGPFGDTAIRALYDDANDLGAALKSSYVSKNLKDAADEISKTFVQFAGHLALDKVLQSDNANAVNGVLSYINGALTVNFANSIWNTGGNGAPAILARIALTTDYLATTGVQSSLNQAMNTLWGSSSSSVFEKVVFAGEMGGVYQISTPVTDSSRAALFIGGNQDAGGGGTGGATGGATGGGSSSGGSTSPYEVLGSSGKDLIIGGDGMDTLGGGDGNDIIYGGVGADTIYGGNGADILLGGSGADTFYGNGGVNGLDGDRYYGDTDSSYGINPYIDSVNYSLVTFGVYLSLGIWANTAQKNNFGSGTGASDTFSKIQNFVLTDSDDWIVIDGSLLPNPTPTIYSIDGGGGTDTLVADGFYYFAEHGILTDRTGNLIYTVSDIEEIRANILPDVTKNGDYRAASFASQMPLDYSFSPIAGAFLIDYRVTNTVTFGSIVHTIPKSTTITSAIPTIYGTNHGDHITSLNVYNNKINFVTGTGDDVVEYTWNDGAKYLYTGGNDTYRDIDGQGISTSVITLSGDILLSDVSATRSIFFQSSTYIGMDVVLTIAGKGTITLEEVYIPVNDGLRIDLASGGYFKIMSNQLQGFGTSTTRLFSHYANNGEDVITGTTGNDTIEGLLGNDTLKGGAGNDFLYGGGGNDVLDGQQGSDTLNGGRGDDRLIYALSENVSFTDIYDGSIGNDTLELRFTTAEYTQARQDDIQDFLDFLATGSDLESYSGSTFSFTTFNLTVSNIEALEVYVDGVLQSSANSAPIANNDSVSTLEDTAAIISVLSNDADPDNDSLTVISVTQPGNGAVVLNSNNTITYTPSANYFGSDSFSYTISDGNGGTSTATVNVNVTSVNDAPLALADTVMGISNTSVIIHALENDSDVDGDTLSINSWTSPISGTLVKNSDNTFTYTPLANYAGSDNFEYTVSDGRGGMDTATVNIFVGSPPPSAPSNANIFLLSPVTVNTVADSWYVNLAPGFVTKTMAIAFETGSDVITRQVVYEQGGAACGLNIFIENGKMYHAMWNYTAGWGYKETEVNIESNEGYTATLVFNANVGTMTSYLNGFQVGQQSGVGWIDAHPEDVGIGWMKEETRFHGIAATGDGYAFDGIIDKAAQYDTALAGADLQQLHDYMGNVLHGSVGNDVIYGYNTNDNILGNFGNDIIYGNRGNDILCGQDGNDVLYGGAGLDILTGGAGSDMFVMQGETAFDAIDVITDFTNGVNGDFIDISDVLLDYGYDPLTDLIANWVSTVISGSDTLLQIDRDGLGSSYSMTNIALISDQNLNISDLAANGNIVT